MLMMLPFEAPTIFEGIHKSYFQMPRVVKDQRSKFENDDLFRQLSHESAVKYTGFKDRPLEERQMKFIANCQEGHTEVSVVQSGNQFTLMFNPTANPAYNNEGCDFDKELGKVHIKSGFILNGVCVLWRGWIDLQRLEGFGCLEFDEYRAYLEDAMLKQQIDKQQACNNNSLMNHQNSPLNRLNHHPLGAGAHLSAAAAAAAVAANSLPPPVGLNPAACLGVGPPPLQSQQQTPVGPPPPPTHLGQGQLQVANSLNSAMQAPPLPPTVSLADSAAHYGNAAIAAAAAAAFHQALSVGAPPPPPPPVPISVQPNQPSSLAQPSGPAQSQQQQRLIQNHPSLAAPGLLSTGANQHLSGGYTTNGLAPNGNNSCILPSNQAMMASQSNNNRPSLNGSSSSSSSSISSSGGINKTSPSHSPLNHHHASSRSPEIENHLNSHHHHHHQHHQHHHPQQQQQHQQQQHSHHQRQSTKRSHEELTQIDDVDVVSDIHSHDLDFPPRRIFKSAPITTGAIHHHRATRRA